MSERGVSGDPKKKQDRHLRLKASIWLDDAFIARLPVNAQWLYVVISASQRYRSAA